MDDAIARYPADRKRSAAMPLLHLWQEEFGFISDEGVRWVAAKLELQPINILELVTFYPMYRQAPVGKTHIRVCRTLSCVIKLWSAPALLRASSANTTTTECTPRSR